MWALIAAAMAGGPGFFERDGIDFWGVRESRATETPDPWAGSNAPEPVRQLLRQPTAENARSYVAWQRRRLERLRAALAAVAEVSRPRSRKILYFARKDCRFCDLQEKELAGLPVARVESGSPLWKRYRVAVTPTLVVNGKVFRGLTARGELLKELNR